MELLTLLATFPMELLTFLAIFPPEKKPLVILRQLVVRCACRSTCASGNVFVVYSGSEYTDAGKGEHANIDPNGCGRAKEAQGRPLTSHGMA